MVFQLTTETFLERAAKVWGERWDYSQTIYTAARQKLTVVCRLHGDFEQLPKTHLFGTVGCGGCSGRIVSQKDFLRRARETWGDRWNYSQTLFKSATKKITVICKLHGPFEHFPKPHIEGTVGCIKCRGLIIDTAHFIEEAEKVWGQRWSYQATDYKRLDWRVSIACEKHGEFQQEPKAHLRGVMGCKRCRGVSLESFIERSKVHYGEKYDYSKVSFRYVEELVNIGCPVHGEFSSEARGHMRGHGCPRCGVLRRSVSFSEFLKRAEAAHGDRYSYYEELWDGAQHITINCSTHGDFTQNWYNHTKGMGCHQCAVEKMTLTEEEFAKRLKVIHGGLYTAVPGSFKKTTFKTKVICSTHGEQSVFPNNVLKGQQLLCCSSTRRYSLMEEELFLFVASLLKDRGVTLERSNRSLLQGLELDLYSPELGVAIEFNGDYWHSESVIQESRGVSAEIYHRGKLEKAAAAGVELLFVWESQWVRERAVVEEALKAALCEGLPAPSFLKRLKREER